LFTIVALGTSSRAADTPVAPDISPEEYLLYRAWKDGSQDPRLVDLPEKKKLRKIAAQEGAKVSTIKAVIAKVGPLRDTLGELSAAAIRYRLTQTPVGGKVRKVEVNTASGHVVAYIKWLCGDRRDIDIEASHISQAAGAAAPVVKTVALWCVNGKDTKLFSAKIGRAAFNRIRPATIPRFASTRYIRLFENIKRGPHR